jgi:hypothetical protein
MSWTDNFEGMAHNAIPLYGLRLCVSLNEDGCVQFDWAFDNAQEADAFQVSGILQRIAQEVVQQYMERTVQRD